MIENFNSIIILLISIFVFFLIFNRYNYSISQYLKLVDHPNSSLKAHEKPTPITGGIFLYVCLIIIIFFQKSHNNEAILYLNYLDFFFVSCLFYFGILDDKFNLGPNIKLLVLALTIFLLLLFNNFLLINKIEITSINLSFNVMSINYFITALSILLFINASNMFDGLDGQSGFYFLILFLFLGLTTKFNLILFGLIFSIVLFLILNLKKKIFLGDSGIFLLSSIFSIMVISNYQTGKLISEEIFLLMMIPGIDMFRLFVERIARKKNPFKGDRNHLHHILLNSFSEKKVLQIIIFLILIPNLISYFFDYHIYLIALSLLGYLGIFFYFKKKNV